jgi:hypothetical protein
VVIFGYSHGNHVNAHALCSFRVANGRALVDDLDVVCLEQVNERSEAFVMPSSLHERNVLLDLK